MKAGAKSSEFIIVIVAALLPIISEMFGLDLPIESILALLAYILGRTGLKIAEVVKAKK